MQLLLGQRVHSPPAYGNRSGCSETARGPARIDLDVGSRQERIGCDANNAERVTVVADPERPETEAHGELLFHGNRGVDRQRAGPSRWPVVFYHAHSPTVVDHEAYIHLIVDERRQTRARAVFERLRNRLGRAPLQQDERSQLGEEGGASMA